VLVFDNRGVGQTDKPDNPYTIELMADDTAGLLQAVGIAVAYVLVGEALIGEVWSNGAQWFPVHIFGYLPGVTDELWSCPHGLRRRSAGGAALHGGLYRRGLRFLPRDGHHRLARGYRLTCLPNDCQREYDATGSCKLCMRNKSSLVIE
jgi:pimeloyl-ACP methyl ester carboxylesterase